MGGWKAKKGNIMNIRNLNLAPVPTEVVEHVKEYLIKRLPQYELIKVVRKSDHIDDDYLYMVFL